MGFLTGIKLMKVISFFIIILWMAMTQDNSKYHTILVHSVDSVRVVNAEDKTLTLSTISAVPNPCYKYSHYTLEKAADTLFVRIFSKIEKNINCIQMIGKMEAEIIIPVENKGAYKVVFPGEFKSLEKNIEVK